jgi:UrcA family protein
MARSGLLFDPEDILFPSPVHPLDGSASHAWPLAGLCKSLQLFFRPWVIRAVEMDLASWVGSTMVQLRLPFGRTHMTIHPSVVQRRLYALVAASTLVLTGTPIAPAFAAGNAAGVSVRYANRDLGSEANARQLLGRIEVAAHEVCGDQEFEPLTIQLAARRCYLGAVARAVEAVNAPRVKAAYVAKYGPRQPIEQAGA